jgi:hypothetical protein
MRLEDLIVALCERYRVLAVHVSRGGFLRSAELLEARGVPVVEAPYSPTRLVEFSGAFDRLLRSGKLIHDGDPTTRAQVLAVSAELVGCTVLAPDSR